MPNYTAEYNGKKVTLTGDTPPTEKDFDAAFAQIDNKSSDGGEPINANNGVVSGRVQENALADSAKGLVSGLTEIPRAIEKFTSPVVNPIANAISYPISQGINVIKGRPTQSFGDYNNKQNNLKSQLNQDYKPQTGWGKASKFVGGLLPYIPIKGGKLAVDATTGAIQGGVGAINNNQNPFMGALQGAGISAATNGLLKGGGQAYEKIAPKLGSIAGIGANDYKLLFDNMKNPTSNMPVNRAMLDGILGRKSAKTGEIVGNEVEKLKAMPDLNRKEINSLTQDTINKYANGASINPTADAVRPDLKQIQKYLDEGNSQLVQLPNGQTMTSEEFTQFFPDMKPKDINAKEIDLGGIKPINLQVIKQDLQDKLDFNPDNPIYTKQGSALLRDLQHQYKSKLEEISPELGQANKAHAIAKSAEKFNKLLPQGKYHKARIAAEIAGIIPAMAGGMTHNPFLTSFGAVSSLFSPLAHGIPMATYETGTKIAPYLPRAVTTGTTQK